MKYLLDFKVWLAIRRHQHVLLVLFLPSLIFCPSRILNVAIIQETSGEMIEFLFSLSSKEKKEKKSHKLAVGASPFCLSWTLQTTFSVLFGGGWQSLIKGEIRFFPLTALIMEKRKERRRRRRGRMNIWVRERTHDWCVCERVRKKEEEEFKNTEKK